MQRYRFNCKYKGDKHCGWAKSKTFRQTGVSNRLDRSIRPIVRNIPTHVVGSGRTDGGVHAVAQPAQFDIVRQRKLTLSRQSQSLPSPYDTKQVIFHRDGTIGSGLTTFFQDHSMLKSSSKRTSLLTGLTLSSNLDIPNNDIFHPIQSFVQNHYSTLFSSTTDAFNPAFPHIIAGCFTNACIKDEYQHLYNVDIAPVMLNSSSILNNEQNNTGKNTPAHRLSQKRLQTLQIQDKSTEKALSLHNTALIQSTQGVNLLHIQPPLDPYAFEFILTQHLSSDFQQTHHKSKQPKQQQSQLNSPLNEPSTNQINSCGLKYDADIDSEDDFDLVVDPHTGPPAPPIVYGSISVSNSTNIRPLWLPSALNVETNTIHTNNIHTSINNNSINNNTNDNTPSFNNDETHSITHTANSIFHSTDPQTTPTTPLSNSHLGITDSSLFPTYRHVEHVRFDAYKRQYRYRIALPAPSTPNTLQTSHSSPSNVNANQAPKPHTPSSPTSFVVSPNYDPFDGTLTHRFGTNSSLHIVSSHIRANPTDPEIPRLQQTLQAFSRGIHHDPASAWNPCRSVSSFDITQAIHAALLLTGKHDYSAFRNAECQADNAVRRIDNIIFAFEPSPTQLALHGFAHFADLPPLVFSTRDLVTGVAAAGVSKAQQQRQRQSSSPPRSVSFSESCRACIGDILASVLQHDPDAWSFVQSFDDRTNDAPWNVRIKKPFGDILLQPDWHYEHLLQNYDVIVGLLQRVKQFSQNDVNFLLDIIQCTTTEHHIQTLHSFNTIRPLLRQLHHQKQSIDDHDDDNDTNLQSRRHPNTSQNDQDDNIKHNHQNYDDYDDDSHLNDASIDRIIASFATEIKRRRDAGVLGDILTLEYTGRAFLHNQIRILTGAIIQAGFNQIQPNEIGQLITIDMNNYIDKQQLVIDSKQSIHQIQQQKQFQNVRQLLSSKTAPSSGLYLTNIYYPFNSYHEQHNSYMIQPDPVSSLFPLSAQCDTVIWRKLCQLQRICDSRSIDGLHGGNW